MIVIGYRGDLDQALRRRNLDPFYLVPGTFTPPTGTAFRRVSDMENAQEVLRAVLSSDVHDAAGALSLHEMGIFTAAFLRQQLGLPGNTDLQRLLRFRDKYLQKSGLPAGIGRARCRYATADDSFEELVRDLGDVLVVKPADGAGAVRTRVVRSADEYAAAMELFSGQSDVQTVAESYVAGPEVYVDGIWWQGELRWWSLSRYHVPPIGAEHGRVLSAHHLDVRRHPTLFRQAQELARAALTGLEAPDCVFHLEAFDTPDGLVFGECAVRIPGGLCPQMTKIAYDVDLFDAEIDLALGNAPAPAPAPVGGPPERLCGEVLLRPGNGTLTQQDFERRFRFDLLDYRPDAPPGPYGSVGRAIVSDPDEEILQKTIEDIVRLNETHGHDGNHGN